jgi:hypothetical protein
MGEDDQVIEHGEPDHDMLFGGGSTETVEAVDEHVEEHLGEIEWVSHELMSDQVHVDVRMVEATKLDRDMRLLVTSGMSDRAMTVPEDAEQSEYAELVTCLPGDWPIDEESVQDPSNGWPIVWTRFLARFPHQHETWLGPFHTIPNADPPEPLGPGTEFCGSMLIPPVELPEEFRVLETEDGREIHFLQMVPLYEEELNLKLYEGAEGLLDRLEAADAPLTVAPGRENVGDIGWFEWLFG